MSRGHDPGDHPPQVHPADGPPLAPTFAADARGSHACRFCRVAQARGRLSLGLSRAFKESQNLEGGGRHASGAWRLREQLNQSRIYVFCVFCMVLALGIIVSPSGSTGSRQIVWVPGHFGPGVVRARKCAAVSSLFPCMSS